MLECKERRQQRIAKKIHAIRLKLGYKCHPPKWEGDKEHPGRDLTCKCGTVVSRMAYQTESTRRNYNANAIQVREETKEDSGI